MLLPLSPLTLITADCSHNSQLLFLKPLLCSHCSCTATHTAQLSLPRKNQKSSTQTSSSYGGWWCPWSTHVHSLDGCPKPTKHQGIEPSAGHRPGPAWRCIPNHSLAAKFGNPVVVNGVKSSCASPTLHMCPGTGSSFQKRCPRPTGAIGPRGHSRQRRRSRAGRSPSD